MYINAFHCFYKVLTDEGIRGIQASSLSPLLRNAVCTPRTETTAFTTLHLSSLIMKTRFVLLFSPLFLFSFLSIE